MAKAVPIAKELSSFLPVVVAAVLAVTAGCSAKYNQPLTRQDISTLSPIKAVRYETPGIMKSSGTEAGLLALVTLAAPGGSALFVVGDAYGKARGSDTQGVIPDFGSMVFDRLVEGMGRALPGRADLRVERQPLTEEFSENCAVLEVDVKRLAYGSIDLTRGGIALDRGLDKGIIVDGFLSKTVATLKDAKGEVLWQKGYVYLSKDHDRGMSLEELEADDYCLLKEEIGFAVEKTVEDFITHLTARRD